MRNSPTSDTSRELHAKLSTVRDSDKNAGKRWRANRIIDEFESGFVNESIFQSCARKFLKIPPPDADTQEG